jgi:hypothetical protein
MQLAGDFFEGPKAQPFNVDELLAFQKSIFGEGVSAAIVTPTPACVSDFQAQEVTESIADRTREGRLPRAFAHQPLKNLPHLRVRLHPQGAAENRRVFCHFRRRISTREAKKILNPALAGHAVHAQSHFWSMAKNRTGFHDVPGTVVVRNFPGALRHKLERGERIIDPFHLISFAACFPSAQRDAQRSVLARFQLEKEVRSSRHFGRDQGLLLSGAGERHQLMASELPVLSIPFPALSIQPSGGSCDDRAVMVPSPHRSDLAP